jgi:hypothetical protein
MNLFGGSGASTSHMVFRRESPHLSLVTGRFATPDKGIVADIVERPSHRRAIIGLTLENASREHAKQSWLVWQKIIH